MDGPGSWDGRSAEEVLYEARKALYVMVGFIAVIWALQVVNWASNYQLSNHFGIVPRNVGHLGDIISSPFLHYSWQHIESNRGPMFVFGFLAAYRRLRPGLRVLLLRDREGPVRPAPGGRADRLRHGAVLRLPAHRRAARRAAR